MPGSKTNVMNRNEVLAAIQAIPNSQRINARESMGESMGSDSVRQAKLVISCKVKVLVWNSKE